MKQSMFRLAIYTAAALFLLSGCRQEVYGPEEFYRSYGHESVEVSDLLTHVASQKIYFGHLNDYGARMVSYNLLAFLSNELK